MTAQVVAFEPGSGNTGAFRGCATVAFPELGLVVHEVALYERFRDGRRVRWVHWPARSRRGPTGERTFAPLIEAVDEAGRTEYQAAILSALAAFEQEQGAIR